MKLLTWRKEICVFLGLILAAVWHMSRTPNTTHELASAPDTCRFRSVSSFSSSSVTSPSLRVEMSAQLAWM